LLDWGNHLSGASEEGLGEVLGGWWLWEWLCEDVVSDADACVELSYEG